MYDRIYWPLSRHYETTGFLRGNAKNAIASQRLHSRRDVKTSGNVRDVCKCFRNKVHFVSALSSGPHVTDLGKGPLRELDEVRSLAWVGIEDDPWKMSKSLGVSDRFWWPPRARESYIARSRLSLDGDPERARCSLSPSWGVACASREWMHISATKLCALLGLV